MNAFNIRMEDVLEQVPNGDTTNDNEALPPSYDPGLQIKETRRQTNNTIVVHVDQGAGSTFDRGSVLTGRVVITPKRDMEVGSLLIDFQQIVMLAKRQLYSNFNSANAVSIAQYPIPAAAYPQNKVLCQGFEYTFTFSLAVPQMLHDSQCPHQLPLHKQLPPTVGTPFDWCDQSPDVPDKSVVIAYRIRARLRRPRASSCPRDQYLVKQYKYIRIAPSYPPLQLEPRQYTQSSLLKCGLLKKTLAGNISLTFNTHPILYLTHRWTQIKLLLTAHLSPASPLQTPPEIKHVTYRMFAYSTSSTKPLGYYPQIDDPRVHCVRDYFQHARALDIGEPKWVHTGDGDYRSEVVFRAHLPAEKFGIVPSFFACLSSRQYDIQVTVELKDHHTVRSGKVPLVVAQTHDPAFWVRPDEDADPVPPYYEGQLDGHSSSKYVRLGATNRLEAREEPPRVSVASN